MLSAALLLWEEVGQASIEAIHLLLQLESGLLTIKTSVSRVNGKKACLVR